MSLVDEIYGEVEKLRGMLTAIMVNKYQTRVRMEPALAVIDRVLKNPTDVAISNFIEDMEDLQIYFRDIQRISGDEELNKAINAPLRMIERLLGPDDRIVHGDTSYQ